MLPFLALALTGWLTCRAGDGDRIPGALDLAVGTVLSELEPTNGAAGLLELGPDAIPALFEAVATGRAAALEEQKGEFGWIDLSAAQMGLVRQALDGQPSAALLNFLRSIDRAESRRRSEMLRLYENVGQARDLPNLVSLFDGSARQRLPRSTRDEFQAAFAAILARHPRSRESVERAYGFAPDCLLAGIIWAVGSQASTDRLTNLASLLGTVTEADPLLLAELSRLGRMLPHPVPQDVADAVRRYLRTPRVEVLFSGIDAAESLADTQALPILIDLLDHPQAAVGARALTALRSISGQGYARDRKRWSQWHDKAIQWLTTTAPGLLDNVERGTPGQAANALMELSKWRVFRHELAERIVLGLARSEPESVVLVCSVLGHLASWKAVPALCERLEDTHPDVRRAVLLALKSITKQDLGNSPAAWREWALGKVKG